jgi:hypothetical protein
MRSLLAGFILAAMPHAQAQIDVPRMVEAIVQKEGGSWGDLGGAGNMTYGAWADECAFAYTLSMNRDYALPVYEKRVRRIILELPRHRIRVTPATVYLAWWKGISGAAAILRAGPMPVQGTECENLYWSLAKL